MKRSAFTLIELLVVVAIIVALLAILLPSMGKAIQTAERAVCASNLHQLGNGHLAYAADNRGSLMRAPTNAHNHVDVIPVRIWLDNVQDGEFNARHFERYVGGVDFDAKTLGGAYECPSNGGVLKKSIDDHWNGGWIDGYYSYYAGADTWAVGKTTHPKRLHGTRPGSSTQLLMSDNIFRWWVNTYWTYNHGEGGPSDHWTADGDAGDNPARLTGANQLYGDGGVRWADLDPDEVFAGSTSVGQVIFLGLDHNFFGLD